MKAGEFRGIVITSLRFIEKEIKWVKKNHGEQVKELKNGIKANGDNIISLQKKRARDTGFAAGVGAAAGFIANLLFK